MTDDFELLQTRLIALNRLIGCTERLHVRLPNAFSCSVSCNSILCGYSTAIQVVCVEVLEDSINLTGSTLAVAWRFSSKSILKILLNRL